MFREIKRINPIPYNNFVTLERIERKQAPHERIRAVAGLMVI